LKSIWVPELYFTDLHRPLSARKTKLVAKIVVQVETVVDDVCLMDGEYGVPCLMGKLRQISARKYWDELWRFSDM